MGETDGSRALLCSNGLYIAITAQSSLSREHYNVRDAPDVGLLVSGVSFAYTVIILKKTGTCNFPAVQGTTDLKRAINAH